MNTTTFTWHNHKRPNLPVHQVYGFCFTTGNNVLMVRDKGEKRLSLVGGRLEEGETAEQAMIREAKEEANIELVDVKLLGYLEVEVKNENGFVAHHMQARFVAKVKNPVDIKASNEIEETKEVDQSELINYIGWLKYDTGREIYADMLTARS